MLDLNNFRRALQFTLKWEGGYVNHPNDPGGETKWGIAKRYHPTEDIKNMTPERAAEIYANEYWETAGCNDIPFPYCVAVFDAAVRCGVSRAKDWYKEAENVKDFIALNQRYYVQRVEKKPSQKVFLKGWLNRLTDLRKFVDIAEAT